jgi:hypothetical protein
MNDLEQVEIQIEVAHELIAMRDTCLTLINSKPYKDVVEKGYFKEEAARLVMAKSAGLKPEQLELIDRMIYGVGAFHNFIESVMRRGQEMDGALASHEETRDELLKESLHDGK